MVKTVTAGFTELGRVTMGFVNAIMNFPTWFRMHLVDPLIQGFTVYVVEPLTRTVVPALHSLADYIWSGLTWIWGTLVGWFKSGTEILWGALKGMMEWLTQTLYNLLLFLHDTTIKVGKPIGDFFRSLYSQVEEETGKTFSTFFAPMHMGIVKEMGMGSPEFLTLEKVQEMYLKAATVLTGAFFLPLWGQIPIRLLTWVAGPLTTWLSEKDWRIRVNLRPLGIGVDTQFNLAKAFGASIHTYLRELRRWLEHLGAGYAYGMAIWLTQPMVRILSYPIRNYIPIILPEVPTIVDFTKRTLDYRYTYNGAGMLTDIEPTPFYKGSLTLARYYSALFGYSDESLRWFFSYAPKDFVRFFDRFNRIKNFPISITHELPTPSDLARMMVRDMFGPIGVSLTVDGKQFTHPLDSFERAISMRGMTRDIAYMYYLLHFRYPPPEKLWDFTMRGASGLLWSAPPAQEMEAFKVEAQKLGAYPPVAPIALNFRGNQLLPAFRLYMKWHDMATFSWIKGMPSDNLTYIDVLADIPTRIDQRWMVKWALYETLSQRGVTIESPIREFRTKVVEPSAMSQITMDLTNFCRTLQATGLHPDWVPITAVAEAINALTEERTLLRTGFLNLFKEGFWNVGALEKLLAGFVIASFKVSYIKNMEGAGATEVWETAPRWINQPVMFLPAERKLLELRALMDRALDILRDIARDVARGYSEWIITDYKEYRDRLAKVIAQINRFFSEDYKAITGAELPQELKLSFVEAYYQPYVEGLGIYRDIYTIRRVRYWTQRWLGYAMYRVATGLVKREDMERFITLVVDRAKLTPYEEGFIRAVMNVMMDIAVREYIPTPTMLATISEYMVIEKGLIEKALEERFVPQEWRPLWHSYISLRPIADDVKALLTTYRRALIRVKVPEEIVKKVTELGQQIGYTDREWDILHLRTRLEEMIAESREYIPTPMTLATLAEYMTIPTDFITRVFEARRVPEEWKPFWRDYCVIRPLVDDVRGLLTAYRRALVYVTIPQEIAKKVEDYADKIRFTAEEWNILTLRTNLEELILEAREARREYIPTPAGLATIAEYLPKVRDFFDEVMEARRVPKEWIPLWAEYIDIRPLVGEIRREISRAERLFTRFAITEETYKKVLEAAKPLGYTDKEIELMLSSANYERYWQSWNELVGDPSRLVTLAEHSPMARQLALGQLDKMIDALPIEPESKEFIRTMWHEFIRVRPVSGEVSRYITELISDVAYGLITLDDFRKELEDLKEWGIDDYEIRFYLMLAEKRYYRYLLRGRSSPQTLATQSPSRRVIAAVDRTAKYIEENFSKAPYFILIEDGRIVGRLTNPHIYEAQAGAKAVGFIAQHKPSLVLAGSFNSLARAELERLGIRYEEFTGSLDELVAQLKGA